ncbi:HtaA domain-containing protein [Gleimia hominis]|uniref:HtaA domain-containing protein n=1 Tax=Gleimia hominis TaxID=595468 RepID=A0ABU3IC85_9ACTO|nr:HtaA domain-containing protein [Gleimia hominis]MDT3767989.1 HtaA domain-containing protein [Gleimia hominis]
MGVLPAYAVDTAASNGGAVVATSSAQNERAASDKKMVTGDLNWAVRDSFLGYIQGPIAHGKIEVSDGASTIKDGNGKVQSFNFKTETGQQLDPNKPGGEIRFHGTVQMTGHGGILEMTIANPTIKLTGGDKAAGGTQSGVISAEVKSRKYVDTTTKGELVDYKRVDIASIPQINVETEGDQITFKAKSGTLLESGVAAFGGFYDAGKDMSGIEVTLQQSKAAEEKPEPENPGANDPENDDPEESKPTEEPGANNNSEEKPGNNTTEKPGNNTTEKPKQHKPAPATPNKKPAKQNKSKASTKKECKVDGNRVRVTAGSMSWPLRSSFTSYIRGSIAKGGWDLSNGATWSGSAFGFQTGGGLYDKAKKQGTLHFKGTVHFTGHKGILNTKISNPSVQINGNSGAIYLNISSAGIDGKVVNYGRIHFANVALSNVTASGNQLSVSASSVNLTAKGAAGFAGFYEVGEKMDNFSLSVSTTPASACDPNTGELIQYDAYGNKVADGQQAGGLASTGADNISLVYASVLLAVVGAGALVLRHRRA